MQLWAHITKTSSCCYTAFQIKCIFQHGQSKDGSSTWRVLSNDVSAWQYKKEFHMMYQLYMYLHVYYTMGVPPSVCIQITVYCTFTCNGYCQLIFSVFIDCYCVFLSLIWINHSQILFFQSIHCNLKNFRFPLCVIEVIWYNSLLDFSTDETDTLL